MKACVVIPTKNGGALFERVLRQTFSQVTGFPFEVLIVDSGSTDQTVSLARSSKARLLSIRPEEFQHGDTRNFAVSQTDAEFVAFLTHDALPANKFWLRNLVLKMELHTDVAGAFGRHRAYPECDPFTTDELERLFDHLKELDPVQKIEDAERYASDVSYRQLLHFFSNNNSCLRRSVWEKLPFPSVNFAEDQAWAQKVIEAGYAKVYADDAVVYHSHSFNTVETFRRAFDESRAMRELFDYQLVPSRSFIFKNCLHQLRIDRRLIVSRKLMKTAPVCVLKRPIRVLAKQLGSFAGQRAKTLGHVQHLLSLDQSKKRNSSYKVSVG
ncbi:MAG TPA: glycosyltransferase family 2 protein [Candidatus Melainabacteria bacterium]|nr:glycosyltransferase family 2 protein [Candidatus Melainabacteria bacterium]